MNDGDEVNVYGTNPLNPDTDGDGFNDGAEVAARTDPAKEWFDLLQAPRKRWYSLPDSGHSVAFEQADELHRILLEDVRVGR